MNSIEFNIYDIHDIKGLISMMEIDARDDVKEIDTNDLINQKVRDLVYTAWIKNQEEWHRLTGTNNTNDHLVHDLFVATYVSVYAQARWDLLA